MASLIEVQLQQPQAAGDGHHTFPVGHPRYGGRPKGRQNRFGGDLREAVVLGIQAEMNRSRGSESGLYAAAYRMMRDHLLRVLLSAFAGSAVHRMTAANGSFRSELPILFRSNNVGSRGSPTLSGSRCNGMARVVGATHCCIAQFLLDYLCAAI
jgi:hypothetical protein